LTDELTGIANRRALYREAEQILATNRMLSVVLFDLDHFKEINDTHGHVAGDRILADVAASLRANTRVGDIIGRYGGDEFVLLLPDTAVAEAHNIAERVAASLAELKLSANGTPFIVTASYGVSEASPTLDDALRACDQQLYDRKGKTLTAAKNSDGDEALIREITP